MTDAAASEFACKDLVELVSDYLEGALSPAERARFDEHLETCPFCQTYVEQMRQTIDTLGHLPDAEIAPETRDALLAAFRGWRIRHSDPPDR